MSDELELFESITTITPTPPLWGFKVEGGIWKFDRHGIRFERDDGKEIKVVTLEDDSDE